MSGLRMNFGRTIMTEYTMCVKILKVQDSSSQEGTQEEAKEVTQGAQVC